MPGSILGGHVRIDEGIIKRYIDMQAQEDTGQAELEF